MNTSVNECPSVDFRSIPEPSPSELPNSMPVGEPLIEWINANNELCDGVRKSIVLFLEKRIKQGVDKYNTLLKTFNGRDCLEDSAQEIADFLFYIQQAIMENKESKPNNWFVKDRYLQTMRKNALQILIDLAVFQSL